MNLLKAAAKAAGDVGRAYALDSINERVLEKREQRLMAREDRAYERDKELGDIQYGRQKELSDIGYGRSKELSDIEHQRNMELWQTQRSATSGDVSGYLDLGPQGQVPYGRGGVMGEAVPGSQQAYLTEAKAAAQTDELKQIRKEKLELYDLMNSNAIDNTEFERRYQNLEMRERMIGTEPEKRDEMMRAAKQETLMREVEPAVRQAKDSGIGMEEYQAKLREAGRGDAAEIVPQVWGGGDGATPASQTQTEDQTAAQTWETKRAERLQQRGEQRRETAQVDKTVAALKDHAKKMKGPIYRPQLDAIKQHYEFLRSHVSHFDPKEIRRFNVAIGKLNELSGADIPLLSDTREAGP